MTGEGEDAALILLLRRVDRQWSPRVAALSALVSEFDLLRGSRDLVPRSTPSCRRIVRGQRMCGGRAGLGGAQGQVEQVRRRRAQGSGDRVEHGGRDFGEGSAFQLGVILDLTPARAATSPRRSPGTRRMPTSSRPRPLRSDLGSTRDQELTDLGHGCPCRWTLRPEPGLVGCHVSTPLTRDSLAQRDASRVVRSGPALDHRVRGAAGWCPVKNVLSGRHR